jgi:hypothetical protein
LEQSSLKPSGEKLLDLFDNNNFQISVPHSPLHYTPQGHGSVLDIMVLQNVHLSDVTSWTQITSLSFPTYIIMLALGIFRRFRSLTTELNSPEIHIDTIEEAEKAASNFTAPIASVDSRLRNQTRAAAQAEIAG